VLSVNCSAVRTTLDHQFIVRADLHESDPIEHDDEIGHADRRETEGDEDRDTAAVAFAARCCGVPLDSACSVCVFGATVGSSRESRSG